MGKKNKETKKNEQERFKNYGNGQRRYQDQTNKTRNTKQMKTKNNGKERSKY